MEHFRTGDIGKPAWWRMNENDGRNCYMWNEMTLTRIMWRYCVPMTHGRLGANEWCSWCGHIPRLTQVMMMMILESVKINLNRVKQRKDAICKAWLKWHCWNQITQNRNYCRPTVTSLGYINIWCRYFFCGLWKPCKFALNFKIIVHHI